MDETEGAVACTRDLANNNVVKGKRTKRQRVLSPVPFPSPAPSISTEENEEDEEEDDQDMYNPSSSEFDEEEEDMANCLILLAQGHWPGAEEDQRPYASKRYTSKRFVEGDGFVYQCKTCDRTFPSFQALGGHRASHKKPRGAGVIEEKKIARQLSFLSEDVEEDESKARTSSTNLVGRLQFLGGSYSKSSPKVHECGICGAEFGSGQALGGHMRRHRATVGTPSVPTATSLTLVGEFDTESGREIQHNMTKSKSLLSLDLDLNLPAPTDGEKQQQRETNTNHPNLVMSAGTLVDCHY